MLGTSLQFARASADDRFYNAAKARGNHYSSHQNSWRSRTSGGAGGSPAMSEKGMASDACEPENRAGSDESAKTSTATSLSSSSSGSMLSGVDRSSNLDRFLESTTPSVTAQHLKQTRMRGWRTCHVEYRDYFTLGDLWESFKEWSAYGAGVPLVLNGNDCVVQYYVPYLSGIQLYGQSSRQNSRQLGDDSDIDCYRDSSSSDGSSDYEPEGGLKNPRGSCWNHLVNGSTIGIDRLSVRENHGTIHEDFSSDDSDAGNSQGSLLFQYLERDPPYSREPLADKVSDLASRYYPELRTLRSCDLLPESWLSVAWYPIYRIPTGPTLKDLDACFLTFHSLSTPMRGGETASVSTVPFPRGSGDGPPKVSLPSFGLASYKFKGPLWTPTGGCEKQLASTLLQAADSWLRLLSVDHPDYRFFTTHGAFRR